MKQPFNKYFIGLIFVLCIVFIPNHKVQADISASCLNWSYYSYEEQNNIRCDPDGPCTAPEIITWSYCSSWDPLVASITLNGNQFNKGATITVNANVYFVHTTPSPDTEVELKATVNGVTKTLMTNIFTDSTGTIYTSNGIGYQDVRYNYFHGSADFIAQSTVGDYNLIYTATAKKVTYTNSCNESHMEWQCTLGWSDTFCDIFPAYWEQVEVCTGRKLPIYYSTPNIKTVGPKTVPYRVLGSVSVGASTNPKYMYAGGKVALSWWSTGATSCTCNRSTDGGNCFAGYSGNPLIGTITNILINVPTTFNIVCSNE